MTRQPTAPLANPKWEKFAQLVASGATRRDAFCACYQTTGWKSSSIHERASALAARDAVSARILALQHAAADSAVATAREILEGLTERFRAARSSGETDPLVKTARLISDIAGYAAPAETRCVHSVAPPVDNAEIRARLVALGVSVENLPPQT